MFSFWVARENGWCYFSRQKKAQAVCREVLTYVLRVRYSCGVVLVFWFWREIVFGVTYVLSVRYSCAFVSVFWLWREKFSKWEHVSTKKSYWVTLLWSASQCVYFIRPNTLLLCIFLFCIFLLYHADPQVEVQIRLSVIIGCLPKSNFLYVCAFLAGVLFESSFFSKSRLCTRPLFSHFIRILDRLASQLILWIPPWGQSSGKRLYGSTTLQSR